jgi:hypothetical protein
MLILYCPKWYASILLTTLTLEGDMCRPASSFYLSYEIGFRRWIGNFEENHLRSKWSIFSPILMIDREIGERLKA